MKALKVLGIIGSVILSIIFYIIMMVMIFLSVFTSTLSPDGIKDHVGKIDVLDLKIDTDDNNKSTLRDSIIDELSEQGVDEKLSADILYNKDIEKITNDYLSDVLVYMIYDKEKPYLDSDKVLNSIDKGNIELSSSERKDIKKFIDDLNDDVKNSENDGTKDLELNNGNQDFQDLIDFIDAFNHIKITIVVIMVITFIVLIALMTWSYKEPFMYIAIPSFLLAASNLSIFLIKGVIINSLTEDNIKAREIITNLFGPLFNRMGLTGLICLAIGIIGIVIYIVLKKVVKKKVAE